MPSASVQQKKTNDKRKTSTKELGVRLDHAEMLLNITRTMAAYELLDEMLMSLVDFVTTEVGCERCTIFLNDPDTDELYSRVSKENYNREIRIRNNTGIAGHVFRTGEETIVQNAYEDDRFNRSVDEETGFVTRNILCAPIRTVKGDIIGVAQALNKVEGDFTEADAEMLKDMTTQAAIALQSAQIIERTKRSRSQEMEFFDVVSDVITEIDLGTILQKIMSQVTKMLNSERSTLFINDEKSNELYSQVGEGLGATQIRMPNHLGIAGTVFTSGETINIPHAYADLRFNPSFDKKTGFFTRSILCVPVVNKNGKIIGVTQVLNKRGGPFTEEDEARLKAFTAQVSIALENAKLFEDVQNMKNYNEAMLESMTNGVITLNEDGKIVTCNASGTRILKIEADDIIDRPAEEFFTNKSSWILDKIKRVGETQISEITMDGEIEFGGEKISVNLNVLPLFTADQKKLGSMLMIEDISNEKRMKSTMSRYMDPGLVDQVLDVGEDLLGGKNVEATVLFSDIRGFTTVTEELGAQGTVSLLNEYFTIMVDCIQREGGMLDKFIGDAMMAGFGIPVPRGDDEDRAVRAAVSMITEMDRWNEDRTAHGKRPINMGIGLNTGLVVTGNIGSPKRMDYTMIGDGVNLASRLESACKQYAARILFSEFTYKKLRGTYRAREIDRVVVKGKTEPVNIYEVLDYHTDETFPNLLEVVNQFKGGLEYYRKGKWKQAISAFKEALKLHPEDFASRMYIERCEHLQANPPGDGWNGVWMMTSK